jgi:1,4-alpha-glucan branching enzyme
MSIRKEYLKDTGFCRVKFILPRKIFNCRKKACLVGDFNKWEKDRILLRPQKDGTWSATVDLQIGKEYQFRYFIDDSRWENDDEADGLMPSPYPGSQNSVIVI